ncbi:M48 family metallopeptidase [Roseibium porphyridii]|uniref:M48 family metallopeptidase n=1 Tax=Roseibium porphyridii TaxID=2866279 RepID=A0ABY8FEW7_9HYPH|nr:M48 family metallopeptidase [Roseibium sp. KMA01]WFE91790.1 M48 family metallopeptidase [Roseibium sp. KMA01]
MNPDPNQAGNRTIMQTVNGKFFESGEAKSLPAKIKRTGELILVDIDGQPSARMLELDRVSDKLHGLSRKVYFAGGAVFETEDDAGIDELFGHKGGFVDQLNRFEGSLKWAAASFILCLVVVFGAYRWGLPLAAYAAAHVTPTVYSDILDYGTLQSLDRSVFSASELPDSERQKFQTVFEELLQTAELEPDSMDLEFRKGGIFGANAFALPGGTIVVTDELITFSETLDEVAGVLAHEIGHVTEKHSLQQIYRVAGFYLLIGAVTGDDGQLLDELVAQAGILQSRAYSREFEHDADRVSVELMLKSGRDPLAVTRLLDKVLADCGESCERTDILSTHPGMIDRKAAIKTLIEKQAQN